LCSIARADWTGQRAEDPDPAPPNGPEAASPSNWAAVSPSTRRPSLICRMRSPIAAASGLWVIIRTV